MNWFAALYVAIAAVLPAQNPARPAFEVASIKPDKSQGDAQSQSATTSPTAFEIASIKPNKNATVRPRVGFGPGGRFEAIAATFQDLMTLGFGGG